MYKKLFVKIFIFVFIATNILMPASALAATDATTANSANTTTTTTTTNSSGSSSSNLGTSLDALIQSSATCSIGNILSKLISSTVGKAIQSLTTYLTGLVTGYVKTLISNEVKTLTAEPLSVPIKSNALLTELTKIKDESRQLTAKETGTASQDTDSLLSGFMTGISSVSLDSIMFCIINEIMAYITQSTITWINSGFDGNPVFVDNPGGFFQGIVDKESSNFIKELSGTQGMVANGVSGTIISIADPLRDSVVNSILGTTNSNFATMVAPTMSSNVSQNYGAYMSGQQWPGFGGLAQISQHENNAYGLSIMAQNEMLKRITQEQQMQAQQLLYNNGYQNKTTCPSGKTRSDGSCYPYYTKTTVTGSQIKDELQSRGMSKYMRISFANDFDSIITALVNQLIKIAVTDIYESTK
jgi:hypothetical protein